MFEELVISKNNYGTYSLAGIFVILLVLFSATVFLGLSFTSVTTSSMSPTYKGFESTDKSVDIFNSDFVILQHKIPQIGDVILFKPLNYTTLVFHRVIAISQTDHGIFYLTKGDGNRYTDNNQLGETYFSWIPQSNVVGVAIFTIHYIGWFINQMLSLNFLLTVIGVIAIVFIVYRLVIDEIRKFGKQLKAMPKRNILLRYNGKKIPMVQLHLKRTIGLSVLLILIILPLVIEVANVESNTVNVELLQTDNTPLPNYINLATNHMYFFNREEISYNSQSFDFFDIKLKITSGGIFNSIGDVKLHVFNSNNETNTYDVNQYYYNWYTTAQFAGTVIVNGLLVIPYSVYSVSVNQSLIINIQYSVNHVLYEDHFSRNQTLILS